MRNILKLVVVAIIGLFVLTGCKTAAIQNLEAMPITAEKKHSMEDVKNSIIKAGKSLGWNMTEVKPGHLVASNSLNNKHFAHVNIKYNEKEYSLIYKNSINLKYDSEKGTIHTQYNDWVISLKNVIDFELSML